MRTEDARATEPPGVVNPLRDEDSDPWRPPFRPSRPPFRPPRRNGRLQPGTGGRLPSESLVAFGLESVVAFARNTHFRAARATSLATVEGDPVTRSRYLQRGRLPTGRRRLHRREGSRRRHVV